MKDDFFHMHNEVVFLPNFLRYLYQHFVFQLNIEQFEDDHFLMQYELGYHLYKYGDLNQFFQLFCFYKHFQQNLRML